MVNEDRNCLLERYMLFLGRPAGRLPFWCGYPLYVACVILTAPLWWPLLLGMEDK